MRSISCVTRLTLVMVCFGPDFIMWYNVLIYSELNGNLYSVIRIIVDENYTRKRETMLELYRCLKTHA